MLANERDSHNSFSAVEFDPKTLEPTIKKGFSELSYLEEETDKHTGRKKFERKNLNLNICLEVWQNSKNNKGVWIPANMVFPGETWRFAVRGPDDPMYYKSTADYDRAVFKRLTETNVVQVPVKVEESDDNPFGD